MTGGASAMTGAVMAMSIATAAAGAGGPERPWLDAAVAAGRWIESIRVPTAHGVVWPADPDHPETVPRHLYHGSAGVILFLLELSRATGDDHWLAQARRGADHLLATMPEAVGGEEAGLYTGVAGEGFILAEVGRVTGEDRYVEGAGRCVALLRRSARRHDGGGADWNESTDIISGTAGIGLFLLAAAREGGDRAALELAVAAGERLLELARPVVPADGGRGHEWAMTPRYPRTMPNFSHGTAGVAYFLATLHEALVDRSRDGGAAPDRRFLDAARSGARALLAVADTDGGGCRIHHHVPGGERLFYLGWCHGPAGTARLFERLDRLEPGAGWAEWVGRCARSLRDSGIPGARPEGFWNNVGWCCGSAGVAAFLLDRHAESGDAEALALARRLTDDLLERATAVELAGGMRGMKWVQAEHRVRPQELAAQSGLMQGAAGVGLWLLRLDAHEQGRSPAIRLPDEPW